MNWRNWKFQPNHDAVAKLVAEESQNTIPEKKITIAQTIDAICHDLDYVLADNINPLYEALKMFDMRLTEIEKRQAMIVGDFYAAQAKGKNGI